MRYALLVVVVLFFVTGCASNPSGHMMTPAQQDQWLAEVDQPRAKRLDAKSPDVRPVRRAAVVPIPAATPAPPPPPAAAPVVPVAKPTIWQRTKARTKRGWEKTRGYFRRKEN